MRPKEFDYKSFKKSNSLGSAVYGSYSFEQYKIVGWTTIDTITIWERERKKKNTYFMNHHS